MAKKDINLIRERRKRAKVKAKKALLAQSVSFIGLLAYLIVAFSLLSYSLILKNEAEKLMAINRQTEAQIKRHSSLETQHFFLKDTLTHLTPIIKIKGVPRRISEEIITLLPSGVKSGKLQSSQEGIVVFTGETVSSSSLRELLTRLKQKKNVSLVQIEKAGKQKDSYYFSIKIKFVPNPMQEL